eukprot:155518_1
MPEKQESLSDKQKKILLYSAIGVSVGLLSWAAWHTMKQPKKRRPIDSLGVLSEVDEKKLDDRQLLTVLPNPLPDRSSYMRQSELVNLIKSGTSHVIIDVRDEKMDYSGGHIVGSVNISDKSFYESIPNIILKYSKNPFLIIYCMYSQRRSVKCMEFYVKAISELIANYNKITKTSHYLMYSIKDQTQKTAEEEQNAVGGAEIVHDSSIHLMYRDGGRYGWMDESVKRKKVDINFCDDALIANLQKQKYYVLKGGFFKWINDYQDTEMVEGFDQSHFEMLELRGVYNKKMYYHKNEYFAKKQFMELKEADKSMNFKLNSSRREQMKR